MDHSALAGEAFRRGYNCSQAVVVAFHEKLGLTEAEAAKMASSFGGGMGRLRSVCGAVSGMLLAAGILYGYDTPGDDDAKGEHYRLVQSLAGRFREEVGSLVCREILGNPSSDPTPTPRTPEFYATRPCCRLVMLAAKILDDEISRREGRKDTL